MGKNNKNIYTIGQMAKLCNVSTKLLRYYDNKHILSPAYRDRDNNYRYYTQKQIEEIVMIQELRNIGISLKSIAPILVSRNLNSVRDELEENIRVIRNEIEDVLKKYNQNIDIMLQLVRAIEYVNKPEGSASENIHLVNFPERQIVYSRHLSDLNANSVFINRRVELNSIIRKYGISVAGSHMAIFHDGYMNQFVEPGIKKEGDLETCYEIRSARDNCPHIRTLGSFRALTSIFVGHYRYMRRQYEAMEEWAVNNGYELSNVSLEEYIVGAAMTDIEKNYVTRLYIPLKGSEI